MRLTLQVRSYCDQEPESTQKKTYEDFPILIGRSPSCDYHLSDVSRYISSNHASVTLEQDRLVLHDCSYNGVYINGSEEPLGKGNNAILENGDTLGIGDYILTIATDAFADADSDSSSHSQDHQMYNPFTENSQDWVPHSAKGTPLSNEDVAVEISSTDLHTGSNDDNTDWNIWPDSDNEISDEKPPAPSKQPASPTFIDDIDFTTGASDAITAEPPPFDIPGQPQATTGQTSSPATRTQDYSVGTNIALATFIKNAGLNPEDFKNLDQVEAMQQIGILLNHAVDGIMLLLHSRNEVKKSIRADVTVIAKRNNNPLKFSSSTEQALKTLLLPDSGQGYQNSSEAIFEAVEDLKAHQVAMLEGMKTAVHQILKQFDPKNLENKLEKNNPIAANIPLARKTRLWQLFQERYDDIRVEAESDFREFFGKEFRKAYERQLRENGKEPDF